MNKGHISALCGLILALATSTAAEAKRYDNDTTNLKSRSAFSRESSGSSRSCLTSSARALLNRIEDRFGSVQIISTCRPGARIATSGRPSKHASGNAIDFRVPGRKGEVVRWLINTHHSGGTMTYSDMDHIHIDVGYHFVALGRNSGR